MTDPDGGLTRARKITGAYAASRAVRQQAEYIMSEYSDALARVRVFKAKMAKRKAQPCAD